MSTQRKPLTNPRLTIKEVKLIKALVAGKSNGAAGMIATGSNSLASGATQTGRMLKRDDVQEALAAAFEAHGITLDRAVAPIGRALSNDSVDLQLKGSDRALKLMGIGQNQEGTTNNFIFVARDQRANYDIS